MSRFRRWVPWPIRTLAQLAVVGLVVEFLLLPQLAGAGSSLRTLLDVDSAWIIAALVAELGSLAAFAAATRAMIPASLRPTYRRVLRIDLATIGLNHSAPAGSAAGTALGLRLLREEGVPPSDAAFAKIAQGVGSAVLLVLLLWTALAVAIPLHGSSPVYVTGSVIGLVVVLAANVTIGILHHGRKAATRAFCAVTRRLPFLDDDVGARIATRIGRQLDLAFSDPARLTRAATWSTANWLLDATALWCCLRGYGHAYGYDGLMVSFALAQVGAWLPITPGGLGIVEGILIPTLLGFGGSRATVVVGVITYRLIAFWLTIPLGAAAYGGIVGRRRWGRASTSRPPAEADLTSRMPSDPLPKASTRQTRASGASTAPTRTSR
jgi:uncharacterized protein (TIRG00374 family)